MQKILTTNSNFVDDNGKTYYFHGINIVDKGWTDKLLNHKRKDLWCPREFQKAPMTLAELKILRSMGVNLIRLGITWEGIEPIMGQYDETVISKLHSTVKKCESLGIRVLLDMHQDLYAGWGNSEGDGAPKWATLCDDVKYKFPKFVWAMGYFKGDAITRAFDNFWANKEIDGIGIQDRFAKMWQHLAKSFSDCSNIFGYDILNEPFGGSSGRQIFDTIVKQAKHVVFRDKAFKWSELFKGLLPGMHQHLFDSISPTVLDHVIDPCHDIMIAFDKTFYNPFLKKVSLAIREVDPNSIITVDNNYFSNIGIRTGLAPIIHNDEIVKNQCFSPHAYDFMIDTNQYNYANNARVKYIFDRHNETAKTLNLPVLVGEWGGICFKGIKWHQHIKFLLDYFDNKGWSRLYWQYRPYMYADQSAYIFMRPYVSEINGQLLSSTYKYATNELTIYVKLNEGENNLRIFCPVKPKEVNMDFAKVSTINTQKDIEEMKTVIPQFLTTVKKKKMLKYLNKAILNVEYEQLLGSCFIDYCLPKGEHKIIIKMNKPTNQIDSLEDLKRLMSH